MTESAKKFETIKRDTNQALKFSDMIKTVLQTALETDKLNTETINTMICHSEDFQGKFHSQLNKLKSDLNELNAKLINQSNIRYNNNVSSSLIVPNIERLRISSSSIIDNMPNTPYRNPYNPSSVTSNNPIPQYIPLNNPSLATSNNLSPQYLKPNTFSSVIDNKHNYQTLRTYNSSNNQMIDSSTRSFSNCYENNEIGQTNNLNPGLNSMYSNTQILNNSLQTNNPPPNYTINLPFHSRSNNVNNNLISPQINQMVQSSPGWYVQESNNSFIKLHDCLSSEIDLKSGTSQTFDIYGNSTHPLYLVDMTRKLLFQLKNGQQVDFGKMIHRRF